MMGQIGSTMTMTGVLAGHASRDTLGLQQQARRQLVSRLVSSEGARLPGGGAAPPRDRDLPLPLAVPQGPIVLPICACSLSGSCFRDQSRQ